MGNLIKWLVPDTTYGWDMIKILRSQSKNGTYSLIHSQEVINNEYYDTTGTASDWYKLVFYNSTTGDESNYTPPLQAEHFRGYATIQEVRDFTRVTKKEFDDSTIQLMIDRATSRINEETSRIWGGQKIVTKSFSGDGTDTLFFNDADVSEILRIEVDENNDNNFVTKFAQTKLLENITSTAHSIPVDNTTVFPSAGIISIDDEQLYYGEGERVYPYDERYTEAINGYWIDPEYPGNQYETLATNPVKEGSYSIYVATGQSILKRNILHFSEEVNLNDFQTVSFWVYPLCNIFLIGDLRFTTDPYLGNPTCYMWTSVDKQVGMNQWNEITAQISSFTNLCTDETKIRRMWIEGYFNSSHNQCMYIDGFKLTGTSFKPTTETFYIRYRGYNGSATSPTNTSHTAGTKVYYAGVSEFFRIIDGTSLVLLNNNTMSYFPVGQGNIRITYKYGSDTIPSNIKHLCLLMVSQMMNIEDPRTNEIDRLVAENKWKGPVGIA